MNEDYRTPEEIKADEKLKLLNESDIFIPIEETNLDKYFPKKDESSSKDK